MLPRGKLRWRPAFEIVLQRRRCHRRLDRQLPGAEVLGRVLHLSHGVMDDLYRGPTPSAGGLQALELYLVHWRSGWLPPGAYHYDRRGHQLAQVVASADAAYWERRLPSLQQIDGGALIWLLVGDSGRVSSKYDMRADRFLLLEAGHLMQNLCLVSESMGYCTTPLGGCLEGEVASGLQLLSADRVLYAGVFGRPLA
ncbi:MAG: SagB/ThcOx family dehydrogenase [Planctomycetales bacterium]|nr:SagB/ThcOx family dehydrogenase [Planctomycetales bacterium]